MEEAVILQAVDLAVVRDVDEIPFVFVQADTAVVVDESRNKTINDAAVAVAAEDIVFFDCFPAFGFAEKPVSLAYYLGSTVLRT